jgi:hypothetical protein
MAKLPTRDALGPLPLRRGGGRIASFRDLRPQGDAVAAGLMGQGVQNFARGVAKVGDAAQSIQEHQDRQALYETERRFQEFEWQNKLSLDKQMREVKPGEVGGFAERTVGGYAENAKGFLSTVPDQLKQVYDGKLFQLERSNYGSAVTFERTAQKRASLSSIDEQMQTVWQPRASSASGEELPKVQADFEKLVRVNPYLTPIEAEEVIKKGKKSLALAHVYSLVETNPEEAERRLAAGVNDPLFSSLSTEQRFNLHNRAQSTIQTRARQAEAAAEKERKQQGEESLKNVYQHAARGTLTSDMIEDARPYITAAEYRNLLKTQGPDERSQDDPEAIIDLTSRIDTENPAEFAKNASVYMREGKLKTSTYLTLAEKNRAASRDDQPASPYKSGREMVRVTLDPGQLLSGPAAQIARTAQQQAMTEFDNWAAANPRATRADYLNEAQETVKRYQIVPFDQMKLATGLSRYFGPKTRDAVTVEDVDAAEARLTVEMDAGRLTPEQQAFEIRLLQNWREILNRERALKDQGSGRTQRR